MLVAVVLVAAAACGSDGDGDTPAASSRSSSTTTPPEIPTPAGTLHRELPLGDRAFDLYEPTPSETGAKPVVIAFHALNGTVAALQNASYLDVLADEEGFLVAYPRAVEGNWHPDIGSPDIEFTRTLIDELVTTWDADAERIYVTGMSNGGDMSIAAALALPDEIAAVAPVVPALTGEVEQLVAELAAPIPAMTFVGEADPRYQDGLNLLQLWRDGADCTDGEPAEADALTTTSWTCGDGVPFVVHELAEQGHWWFGTPAEPEPLWASDAMWQFFSATD